MLSIELSTKMNMLSIPRKTNIPPLPTLETLQKNNLDEIFRIILKEFDETESVVVEEIKNQSEIINEIWEKLGIHV